MQSYLRLAAAAVLFSLLLAIPVALCIILDTRMNTPPPVPLPEPPKRVEAQRHALEPGDGVMRFTDGHRTFELRMVQAWETNRAYVPRTVAVPTNSVFNFTTKLYEDASMPGSVTAATMRVRFVQDPDDGSGMTTWHVVEEPIEPSARCDCPICREYRDKYPDWESTSHYYKAHKDALKRP